MRVAIVGAGAVGRSVAQALLDDRHKVLLIERDRAHFRPRLVPDADWMLADACELGTLVDAGIRTCDTVMAASGDDKANLVFSLLAKTECHVPRVVARINDPANAWLFTSSWGVDVAVSTPSALVVGVEEAVTIGDIVRVMTLQHSEADILEITLSPRTSLSGQVISELALPAGAAVLAVLRDGTAHTGSGIRLQPNDTLLLAASADAEPALRAALCQ
jgi:trk/ktr system potassium uptake protein